MKIMVSGIGGVGGYIAGALINRYGDAVTLVARGGRRASIEEKGLVIHSDKLGLEMPLTRHYYERLKKRQEEYGTGKN